MSCAVVADSFSEKGPPALTRILRASATVLYDGLWHELKQEVAKARGLGVGQDDDAGGPGR